MEISNYCNMFLSGTTANVAFARSTVAAFCAPLEPTLEEINDVKTAVSEAVNNCIVHGYQGTSGEVHLEILLFEAMAQVTVQDYGCGFDNIDEAMQPFFTSKPQDERSGMGFTLMQAFMDEVEVRSEVGKGTTVVMRKRFGQNA